MTTTRLARKNDSVLCGRPVWFYSWETDGPSWSINITFNFESSLLIRSTGWLTVSQVIFWSGTLQNPVFDAAILDAWPMQDWCRGEEGWGGGGIFPSPSPPLWPTFSTKRLLPRETFPRPNPPQLQNPGWRPNAERCARASKIRLHCRLSYCVQIRHPCKLEQKFLLNSQI